MGQFTELTSKVMFVGGAHSVKDLPGSLAMQNFQGCMRAVS